MLLKKLQNLQKANTSGLVKKTNYNRKIIEIENKIIDITGLSTTSTLKIKITDIKNEIFDTSGLVTKKTLVQKSQRVKIKFQMQWLGCKGPRN